MKNTVKKAIILLNVAFKEQNEECPITAQKKQLQQYCTNNGLEVLKTFELTESSTFGNRKKFTAAIYFIKKQQEPIAIIIDSLDKLQRDYTQILSLNGLIKQGTIELHISNQACILNKNFTHSKQMLWGISVIMATSYRNSLK